MTTALQLDAGQLAWVADRLSIHDLEREHRAWFEAIAQHLEETLPFDEDTGELELGADPEELETAQTALAVAETELEAIFDLAGGAAKTADDEEASTLDVVRLALEEAREEGVKDATIPSRANTAQRKALRLLVDGRIQLERLETEGELAGLVVASCRGESGETYTLGYDPRRRQWRCTCAELRGQCSHLAALKTVTAARPAE